MQRHLVENWLLETHKLNMTRTAWTTLVFAELPLTGFLRYFSGPVPDSAEAITGKNALLFAIPFDLDNSVVTATAKATGFISFVQVTNNSCRPLFVAPQPNHRVLTGDLITVDWSEYETRT